MIFVYLARRDSLIKIGVSENPSARVRSLGAWLLAHFPAGRWMESRLHMRFAKDRVRGEWFRESKELKAFLDRLADPVRCERFMARWQRIQASPVVRRLPQMGSSGSSRDGYVNQIGVRIPVDDLRMLDAEVARRNMDDPGLRLTRQDVIRSLLLRGLKPALAKAGAR